MMSIMTFFLPSCLEGGLEDLPEYDDANITSVSAVQYRYVTEDKHPASNENIVRDLDLQYKADLDESAGVIKISVHVPKDIDASIAKDISRQKLVVVVNLSTAARLFPLNGSTKLGVPGDWSKVNSYEVIAASGAKKEWIIEVFELTK